MILYDFACADGHLFEAGVASMTAPNPPCPGCGGESRRKPSRVQLGNRASTGPSREQMPKSWNAVGKGDRETIRHWHGLAAKREKLEERHPELAGDRRPILAHEGIFAHKPLRRGDDIAASVAEAVKSGATGHTHAPAGGSKGGSKGESAARSAASGGSARAPKARAGKQAGR